MASTGNENQRNLLDSAAGVFRGRLTPDSRYYALLDSNKPAKAAGNELDSIQPERAKNGLPAIERLARSVELSLPQIGDMPPQPPTLRGRFGAVLVGMVRRALFWYTAQIKTFHAGVADAARELAPALRELDAQQRRQRALIADVHQRLTELERQTGANQAAIASSVGAHALLRDELHQSRETSQQQLRELEKENLRQKQTLAAHLSEIDGALAAARETYSSFREEEERHRAAAAAQWEQSTARWEQMERTVDQYQKAQASDREEDTLQRSALFARLAEIDAALEVTRQAKAALEKELGQKLGQDFKAEIQEMRQQAHEAKTQVLRQELRLKMLVRELRNRAVPPAEIVATLVDELAHTNDSLFVDHSEIFRGGREDIKRRLAVYLPYARVAFGAAMKSPALDLACGRGEWLELLGEAGIPAKGVDLNRDLVGACRERSLNATVDEISKFLPTVPDESLSLVTAFHILEHLPFSKVVEVIDQAARILKPGGIVIFETPNPKNLFVSSNNFYLDPTHLRPIPSEFLAFLVEARGLSDPKVIPLSPFPDYFHLPESDCPAARFLNEHFYGPQDYGVVAQKS